MKRRQLFGTALTAIGGAACGSSAAGTAQAAVKLVDTQPLHPIEGRLFGANLQWEHSGDGALVNGRWTPGLIDEIQALRLASLRFPGGDLANRYRWKAGIGPLDKRTPGLNYSGREEASVFGTDEFISLCHKAGLEPVVTLNANQSADEAADWIDYVQGSATSTWGTKRAQHGQAAPLRAGWWEVGNETFNPNQPGFAGADAYARRFLEFRRVIKARVPDARLGLVLEGSFLQAAWVPRVLPHLPGWNDTVLRVAGSQADFVVMHFYAPHDTVWRDTELERVVMAGADVFATNLQQIRAQLRAAGRPDTDILLSEYGLAFGERIAPSSRIASVEGALFAAALLTKALQVPQVRGTQYWSLLNNSSFGALETASGRLARRPVFDALSTMARLAPGRWVTAQVQAPVFETRALGAVPALSGLPELLVAATQQSDDTLRVNFVNRAADRPLKVLLDTEIQRASASGTVFSAGSRTASSWRQAPLTPLRRDAQWELVLPPHSLASLTLRSR
jgi:alpha-L-arabinofuranosidase